LNKSSEDLFTLDILGRRELRLEDAPPKEIECRLGRNAKTITPKIGDIFA
jgi:hypothetical protein